MTGSRCLELGVMNLPIHARQGSNLAETKDPTMCRAQSLARLESLIGQRVQFGGFVLRLGNRAGGGPGDDLYYSGYRALSAEDALA